MVHTIFMTAACHWLDSSWYLNPVLITHHQLVNPPTCMMSFVQQQQAVWVLGQFDGICWLQRSSSMTGSSGRTIKSMEMMLACYFRSDGVHSCHIRDCMGRPPKNKTKKRHSDVSWGRYGPLKICVVDLLCRSAMMTEWRWLFVSE